MNVHELMFEIFVYTLICMYMYHITYVATVAIGLEVRKPIFQICSLPSIPLKSEHQIDKMQFRLRYTKRRNFWEIKGRHLGFEGHVTFRKEK